MCVHAYVCLCIYLSVGNWAQEEFNMAMKWNFQFQGTVKWLLKSPSTHLFHSWWILLYCLIPLNSFKKKQCYDRIGDMLSWSHSSLGNERLGWLESKQTSNTHYGHLLFFWSAEIRINAQKVLILEGSVINTFY